MVKKLLIIWLGLTPFFIKGQTDSARSKAIADSINDKYLTFYYDGDPFENEEPEVEGGKRKEKKPKKNVFYGIKTKKGYAIEGFGRRKSIETFHYLKTYEEPRKYAKYVYWYNFRERKIKHGNHDQLEKEKDVAKILHGPYELREDTNVIETGMFYKGTKDGRWMKYGKSHEHKYRLQDSIPKEISYQDLVKKEHWKRGLPASSKITYFTPKRLEIKEVEPYDENGVLNGYYVKYFKDGHKEEFGYYKNNVKIGTWYTYQINDGRYRRKKIMSYPKEPDSDEEPEVVKEWNEEGRVIMDHNKPVDPTKRHH